MWLSGKSGHNASSLISQEGSTIKCRCPSWYDLICCQDVESQPVKHFNIHLQPGHTICTYVYMAIYVLVCTDLLSEEPYRQLSERRVVTSGNLAGVHVSALAHNSRDVGLIPTLGKIFPIFITPMILVLWPASCTSDALYVCWNCLIRQVNIGWVGTWGSLGGVMVTTLAQNARDVGSIPVLGTIFQNVITPTIYMYNG